MLEIALFFALSIAFMSGISSVIHRHVLKDEDPIAYALAFQIFSALFFIPLFAIEWSFPTTWEAWFLAIIASILWAAISIVGFTSYKFAEVSLRSPIGRSKVLWIMIFAALLIGEAITTNKLLGGLLIFIGVVIVTLKLDKPLGGFGDVGVKLTLISALMGAMVAIVDKTAMSYFRPGLYGFIQYLLPTIWLWMAIPQRTEKVKKLLTKGKGKWVIITSLLATIWTWMLFRVYQLADVSLIAPILELSVIIAAVGGIVLLGERKDILRKIIGAIIVIIGIIIVGS
jgi:uncharacterized membrane protein